MERAQAEAANAQAHRQPLREATQQEGDAQPQKSNVQHGQQLVLEALHQTPHPRQPHQNTAHQHLQRAVHHRPCGPGRAGGNAAPLQPRSQHLHTRCGQHEPQHPERAPGLHQRHGAGGEERNHAVGHRDVDHHHKAPQCAKDPHSRQCMGLQQHGHPNARSTQGAQHAGKANHAGMELVFRLAQAHPAPELHRHPRKPDARQAQANQRQSGMQMRTGEPQQPTKGLQKQRGPYGRHGQRIHPQPLGACGEQEASKVQRNEPEHHHRRMHQRGRHSVARGIGQAQPARGPVHLYRAPPQRRRHQHHHRQEEAQPVGRQHEVLHAPVLVQLRQRLFRGLA